MLLLKIQNILADYDMKWKMHGQMVNRNDPFIKDSPSVSYAKGGNESVETPLEKVKQLLLWLQHRYFQFM